MNLYYGDVLKERFDRNVVLLLWRRNKKICWELKTKRHNGLVENTGPGSRGPGVPGSRGPGVPGSRGVENTGCGKRGVWKTRGVENTGSRGL